MYKKALVVEDLESIGQSIEALLVNELEIDEVCLTQHCDEAFLKLKKAHQDAEPFDILITDMSFVRDYRPTDLNSGSALVNKVHQNYPDLKTIVFSVEDSIGLIRKMVAHHGIAAYVIKGRNGLKELKNAITESYIGNPYFSPQIQWQQHTDQAFEIGPYDISIMENLSKGLSQNQIASKFNSEGISPSSLSSIEKRLNKLKDILKANNNVQLVSNAKDIGLI